MSTPLRVVIVTESFLPQINGVTNSVLRVLEYLRSHGHEALVIAPESAGGVNEYAGFRVKRVPSIEMKGMLPVGFPQKTLEPLIDGFSPDVIHLASPFFLGNYAARIAERLEIPTLSIYQTDVAGFARHYGLTLAHDSLKKWVARIHAHTTRTLAPSNWSCEDLKKSGVNNVHLWQRGVDSMKFSPDKRDINLRCELLGTRPDRKLVGYQGGEDLASYYASLDIFVHTGKHETFCQSIQEALASGVPVIAPNSGGPTDLVKHGWTGFLIDTSNSYSLNHSVNQILHSSEHRLMSERARESVIHRSWEVVNSQLISHYKDLVLSQSQQNERVA